MEIDILVEDARWEVLDLATLAGSAFDATFAHLECAQDSVSISVLGCDDARIAELNAQFREKSRPTNVLSWPEEDLAAAKPGGKPHDPKPDFDGTIELGDIAISYDTCACESASAGKPMSEHVTHLLVHGLLHLLGYDHIRDLDATLMERLESEILGKLGLDDPYRN